MVFWWREGVRYRWVWKLLHCPEHKAFTFLRIYTQHNGIGNRVNRTLLDMVQTILGSKSSQKSFGGEAVVSAVLIRNGTTFWKFSVLCNPFWDLVRKKRTINILRVFGGECWYTLPSKKFQKLDDCAISATSIGYSVHYPGYKDFDYQLDKTVISRDSRFDAYSNIDIIKKCK